VIFTGTIATLRVPPSENTIIFTEYGIFPKMDKWSYKTGRPHIERLLREAGKNGKTRYEIAAALESYIDFETKTPKNVVYNFLSNGVKGYRYCVASHKRNKAFCYVLV
jgi:hypothetical protein